MSPSIVRPAFAIAAAAFLTAALPVAASAHGTCKPAKAVHKAAYKAKPKPVKTIKVKAAPCNCATRTVVRYVEAPARPVVRRVVVYRTRQEPVYVHAPYVDERPVVHHRYAYRSYDRHDSVRHDYARRDVSYDGRWRHYGWGYE